jgi:hypothetical protein
MQATFESYTFAAAEPPALNESLKIPQRKGFAFLEQKPQAEVFACKLCSKQYTDKRNYGHCSSTCRDAKNSTRGVTKRAQCEHGRQKDRCKDCGTGTCEHGRQKGRCRGC